MMNTDFRIDPLDINIAKIQFGLTKLPEKSNNFEYINTNKALSLDSILVHFEKENQDIILYAEFFFKNKAQKTISLFRGNEEEYKTYIKTHDFFHKVKETAKSI